MNRYCLLFNPGDTDKLAEQMEMMISSEKLRGDVAAESSGLAKGIFSVEEVTKRLEVIYRKLA